MIITDPALIALQASMTAVRRTEPRSNRFRLWAKPLTGQMFRTDPFHADNRTTRREDDRSTAAESGGSLVHATSRRSIDSR